jgi:hypothetical protein
MKTAELTGAALDWAVAKCEGYTGLHKIAGRMPHEPQLGVLPPRKEYGVMELWELCYSTDWAQGGPIIEREKLGVWFSDEVIDEDGNILREMCWYCETSCTADNGDEPYKCEVGQTPLIAAMRCYVASKLGDEIEIPKELQ